MLKRFLRLLYRDTPGLVLKLLTTAFAAGVLLFFVGFSIRFWIEDGSFGLFGNQLGIALDQAPWVDLDTVSAWEIYDLDNYALLLLYCGAALLFRYGLFIALGIALLWTALRLILRRAELEKNLRYLKIIALIQGCIPTVFALITLFATGVFKVGTWVHTPLLEVATGNIIFCVLIPLLYMLLTTALCYAVMALPLLILQKRSKKENRSK